MGNIFRQAVARAADTDACHWPCAPRSSLPLYLPSSGAAPAVSITTSFTPIVSALLGCNPDYIHHNELRVFTVAIPATTARLDETAALVSGGHDGQGLLAGRHV